MNLPATYRALLRLYPCDYTASFADEMLAAFRAGLGERCGRGDLTAFLLTEFAGALAGAAREWIAKLTTDRAVRGRFLPDLRMMRPAGVSREDWFSAAAVRGYKREETCWSDTSPRE
jgi:hypothetical protein